MAVPGACAGGGDVVGAVVYEIEFLRGMAEALFRDLVDARIGLGALFPAGDDDVGKPVAVVNSSIWLKRAALSMIRLMIREFHRLPLMCSVKSNQVLTSSRKRSIK